MRPPFETFKFPTCRGSIALGNACNNCEKCEWERHQGVLRIESGSPAQTQIEKIEPNADMLAIVKLYLEKYELLGELDRAAFRAMLTKFFTPALIVRDSK
jgi:hypothetical protein